MSRMRTGRVRDPKALDEEAWNFCEFWQNFGVSKIVQRLNIHEA